MGVFATIIRQMFFAIDKGIYFLVSASYDLIKELSRVSVLRQETVADFAQRIYYFLAIFMLFKIAVSLINYFINPDSFKDNKTGMGGVLKRIILSLVLLVAVPFIFQQAFELQDIIVEKNILATVLFGEPDGDKKEHITKIYHDGGDVIGMELFKAFFRPKVKEYDPLYDDDEVTEVGDLEPLVDKGADGEYEFDYKIPLTTLAGGFTAWIMVMFCFDVAIRSVKLSFMQLIAPIPIISYIEPKKGEKIFNDWISECVSTYLSLFLRLIALYFVMYIIAELSYNDWALFNLSGTEQVDVSPLAYVFVIMGLLLFMKEAPKLIMNLFGIKDSGTFTLNPLKRIQQVPGIGWAESQTVGRVAGGVESMIHDQTGHKGRAFLSGMSAAGENLSDKISFMGTDGKKAVNSLRIGREAGYEVATGNKMKRHSIVNDLFKGQGKKDVEAWKAKRNELNGYLNQVQLKKQQATDEYTKLVDQLNKATTDEQKNAIRANIDSVSKRYQAIVKRETEISGDISTISDQIKDLQKGYDIDPSPNEKLKKINNKTYDLNFGESNTTVNVQNEVNVSKTIPVTPTSDGKIETKSGIIIDELGVLNQAINSSQSVNNNSNNNTNRIDDITNNNRKIQL